MMWPSSPTLNKRNTHPMSNINKKLMMTYEVCGTEQSAVRRCDRQTDRWTDGQTS